MSEFSDDVYQPDPGTDQRGEGQPDLENALDEPTADDLLDTGYSPPDRQPVDGTEEETLGQRLAEEAPEIWNRDAGSDGLGDATDTDGELVDNEVGDRRAGRLVAPDEGAHEDTETNLVAGDVGIDGAGAAAEEAAMHVVAEDDERSSTGG